MAILTDEQIELINAHGPFNHSAWTAEDAIITNEERLSGRGDHLVKLIRKSILDRFTHDEVKKMSIADIGCYDGWILHQLSDLPFRRMVGIEPRQKNIDKGVFIRDILGISSRVEFQLGDMETLREQKYDVVLCVGVIHHLEAPSVAIELLKKGCVKFLFIETICLSSKHITKSFIKEIEMKDIVYNYKQNICGISGQKFESSYYDGSTTNLSVVSIPSIETLKMLMEIKFKNIKIEDDATSYLKSFSKYDRKFKSISISAEPFNENNVSNKDERNWIADYEKRMISVVLNKFHVEMLYDKFFKKQNNYGWNLAVIIFSIYLTKNGWISRFCRTILKFWYRKDSENEIITNLKYNPPDKLAFEYGKILKQANRYKEAITVLTRITTKMNADWRCVYRSFLLLHQIFTELGEIEKANKYKKLCETANPMLPIV